MDPPLAGVRALEVASHVYVPMAGAVMSEWGARVVKIEHPTEGDPYRALVTTGLHPVHRGVDPYFQSANRGKQSVAVDLGHPDGRALLSRLVAATDVFLTSMRPDARRHLRIDVEDVRADNPWVIYVLGTAHGAEGPDAARGGYDVGAFWARSGMQHLMTPHDAPWPRPTRPAFGDVVGGLAIAGAVAAALYRRATTGEPSVVHSSLLACGIWQVQHEVVDATLRGVPGPGPPKGRAEFPNPLMLPYRTADGRFVQLTLLIADRHWAALCAALGQPHMAEDPRFCDLDARRANAAACVAWLDTVFAQRTLEEWREALAGFSGEWTPVQRPGDVAGDPQVRANGYLADVEMANGASIPLVAVPAQFDGRPGRPARAPEHGEHTETALLELGLSWDELAVLKERGAIL